MSALRHTASGGTTAKQAPQAAKTTRTMSIGVVLERLHAEFPDVTVSKIRFLESEGLITPERTASGYRRFTESDVERLRYILVTQRDNYLPLKVIREQLAAMDNGSVTAILGAPGAEPLVTPEKFRAPAATRLTDTEVAEKAGVEVPMIEQLISAKLIKPDASGFFTNDDVLIASAAGALAEMGFDMHQLRSLGNAASRQADLISQVADPVARGKSDVARERAEELAQQMCALVVNMHASLVKNSTREQLGY
ncbi:MerR family transcriptional regulator [Corynebacterium pacaense]|uniref:transcriptional regulator FtsR n=1 Tax=Corynebacterium pacaense TaxID=1816684 RepID=UPI0009BB42FA|nr:MerR family transcriptional regulator [Corynebacterium pacaense]